MTPQRSRVEIEYCTQCRWLLRAAWMAQELLTTFQDDISELALIPGTGGVFNIRANGELLWSRTTAGRFPDIMELKQLIRDRIWQGSWPLRPLISPETNRLQPAVFGAASQPKPASSLNLP
jgi:selenoprotein W-related protein